MKKQAIASVAATLVLATFAGSAIAQQANPWLARARAVHIDPADKADPLAGAGAADRVTVADKTIAEFDISYFFTDRLAAELILTYPQKHAVYLDGAQIGSFKHLPPTLSLQYHFAPAAQFSPYVGVGVNYTNISKVKLLNGVGTLENHSFGLAVQAGVDFKIDNNWSVNLDLKKVQIGSDLMLGGAKASHLKVDPLLVGVGVGYRF